MYTFKTSSEYGKGSWNSSAGCLEIQSKPLSKDGLTSASQIVMDKNFETIDRIKLLFLAWRRMYTDCLNQAASMT